MNKTKLQVISTLLILILISSIFMPLAVKGDEEVRKAPDGSLIVEFSCDAVTDGKYLYYCPNYQYGLTKRNLKTGKQVIISDMIGAEALSIHGNKIYFSYMEAFGRYFDIFRMDKDGKNVEKLALGHSPTIVGKYIYYVGGKIEKDSNLEMFSSDGIYRMSLSGTDKEKVISGEASSIVKWGSKLYYNKDYNGDYYDFDGNKLSGKIIPSLEYNSNREKYYKIKGDKVLEGSYKNGKFQYKTIATFKNESVWRIVSCGNNILVVTRKDSDYAPIGKYYLVNSKGKKTFLKKSLLAG